MLTKTIVKSALVTRFREKKSVRNSSIFDGADILGKKKEQEYACLRPWSNQIDTEPGAIMTWNDVLTTPLFFLSERYQCGSGIRADPTAFFLNHVGKNNRQINVGLLFRREKNAKNSSIFDGAGILGKKVEQACTCPRPRSNQIDTKSAAIVT